MIAPSLFSDEDLAVEPGRPSLIVLRPYQEKARAAVLAARDRGLHRVLVVCPTGTGKTTLFSRLVGDWADEGLSSLVIAHREELLQQAAERIAVQNPGLRVGVEGGASRTRGLERAVVAGVQSIGRPSSARLDWFSPSLIICDEAHHGPADSYQNVFRRFGAYEGLSFLLGVTATPHRMDNRPLHGQERAIFEEVVFTYTLKEAIEDGWLCDLRGYRVASGIDLSHVRTTAGDYNQGQLQRAVDTERRNDAAIKHWREVAAGRRTIVFCAGVDHAVNVAEMFVQQGVKAEAVYGSMDSDERSGVIRRFRRGETQVLTNMDIATEGFDCPEIECVLMLRPTQSWALFTQMVGRGLRTADGKRDCIVIDVVDNTAQHNIATVPALIGLPAGLDLNGNSLKEAARLADEMDPRARAVLFKRPCSFDDLSSKLTAVDLLSELAVPENLKGQTRMAWLKVGEEEYALSCGPGREARVKGDALGVYRLILTQDRAVMRSLELRDEIVPAFHDAESAISSAWPDAGRFALLGCKWRNDRPTEGQIRYLRLLGVEEQIIEGLNKGQASQLIDARRRMKK